MKSEGFRRIALSMPGAVEGSHMGHADFRVGGVKGKIFATLPKPDEEVGMVKLSLEDQDRFVEAHPGVFVGAAGAWGRAGCTYVQLRDVRAAVVRKAMQAAWRKAAPEGLAGKARPGKGT